MVKARSFLYSFWILSSILKRINGFNDKLKVNKDDGSQGGITNEPQLILEMSTLLADSYVVARIQKLPEAGGADREKMRQKMQESRYQRLLGKPLNRRMRGTSVKERYYSAEMKASLAIGTGHLTGLITAFAVGYYLVYMAGVQQPVAPYIGGLVTVVIFLIVETSLFIFREARIDRAIKQAENGTALKFKNEDFGRLKKLSDDEDEVVVDDDDHGNKPVVTVVDRDSKGLKVKKD